MTAIDDATVCVARYPGGGRLRARYRLTDLTRPHWDNVSGGGTTQTNRYYIHGYVDCDEMLSGALNHSCQHGPPSHRLKVCVVAVDNDRAAMDHLMAIAGPKLQRRPSAARVR
jgi:hypothetical protein